jgi:hypothetical protein
MVKLGVCRPQKHPITTHIFPNSNIIDTIRLPLISGKKTYSWGKIAVKKTSILKLKTSFAFPILKNYGLEKIQVSKYNTSIAGSKTHSLGKLTV